MQRVRRALEALASRGTFQFEDRGDAYVLSERHLMVGSCEPASGPHIDFANLARMPSQLYETHLFVFRNHPALAADLLNAIGERLLTPAMLQEAIATE